VCEVSYENPAHVLVYDERMGMTRIAERLVCVATWSASEATLCGDPVYRTIAGMGLCVKHWDAVAKWREEFPAAEREEMIAARRARELDYIRQEAEHRLEVEQRRRELGIVYYLRRDDGLIKIGTTWRPASRMGTLRREHGDLRLLLTHSGTHHEEHALHRRFGELRVTGEWFLTRKRLTDWIRKCRLDPLYAEQPDEIVSMDVIREVCREGNIASRIANMKASDGANARAAYLGRLRCELEAEARPLPLDEVVRIAAAPR
jgi:hypothetical protein